MLVWALLNSDYTEVFKKYVNQIPDFCLRGKTLPTFCYLWRYQINIKLITWIMLNWEKECLKIGNLK